jgi:ParB family chromosome partitioning protein
MTAKNPRQAATSAYAGLGDVLSGSGLMDLIEDADESYSMIRIAEITVKGQDRKEFEDAENLLSDFAADIKVRGVLQPILLRKMPDGYELVAGERRLRASVIAGLDRIPAVIRTMTDKEAADAQFAENIQRKNLTQIEEAGRIQRDLDELGSIDAVLAKHNKQRPWLSKMLGLLKLPEESRRLVTEHISADVEVINKVRQVEKANPVAAKKLVDELKRGRGKVDARKQADTVLRQIKPTKKPVGSKPVNGAASAAGKSKTSNFADAKNSSMPALSPEKALNAAYRALLTAGATPKKALASMSPEERTDVGAWLHAFFDGGQQATKSPAQRASKLTRAVLEGLASNQFASTGAGALALVAFLLGAGGEAEYDLLDVLKVAIPHAK